LDRITPNPAQPRRTLDDVALDELTESIRSQGVIQPILVRPKSDEPGRFEIVVGERRYTAARRVGLEAIPCIVRSLDDRETFIISIAENVAREDLHPIDEAAAYRRMLDESFAANQGEIAEVIGIHRTRVSRKLKLLKLDERIQEDVRSQPVDVVSLTHLEELSRLKPGVTQYQLYRSVVDRKLSTRELHARVEACLAPPKPREPTVSNSTLVLESGVRVTVALDKYTLRVPRSPGDPVDLPRIVADLERVVAELKARL
jgi:ParB family chromosome partitioning protein